MNHVLHSRLFVLLFAALVAIAVAACGDDDGGRDSPFAPRSDDTAQSDDRGSSSSDDDRNQRGPLGQSSGSWSDNDCFALGTAFASLFAGTFGGVDLGDAIGEWDDLRASVPSDVRGHFETVRDAFDEFNEIVTDAGWDPSDPQSLTRPEVQQAFERASERMESAEFERAIEEIEAFFSDVCPQFN